jgi:DNA gyrase subunit A
MYFLKAWQIPDVSRYSKGTPLVQLLQKLDEGRQSKDEKVLCMLPVANLTGDGHYFLFATKNGIVKKTRLEEYSSRIQRAWARDQGFRAITLKEKDELIGVDISEGDSQVMLATKLGMANRFSEGEVRIVGRNGQGVIGMRLKEKDEVIGMTLVNEEDILLTITEKGYGKRASASNYRLTKRGAKGVKNIKVDDKSGHVIATFTPGQANQILATTSSGKVIRTHIESIRQIARVGRGVKVMSVDEKETVVAVALHDEEDEERNVDPSPNDDMPCSECDEGKLALDGDKYICSTCGLTKDA